MGYLGSYCFFVFGSTVLAAGRINVQVPNLAWNGDERLISANSVAELRHQIAELREQPVNVIQLALTNGTPLLDDAASWALILAANPHEVVIMHPAPPANPEPIPPPPQLPPALMRH